MTYQPYDYAITDAMEDLIVNARMLRSVGGKRPEYDKGLLDLVRSFTGIPRSVLIPKLNMDPEATYGVPLEDVDEYAERDLTNLR